MSIIENINRKHQEDLQRLKNFRLIDDDFFNKCFEENIDCIQLIIQIVLDMPDLKVLDVRTQVFVENLLNRSVRLDILATDSNGRKFNVEIQRSDKGAERKRARYNSSMMDVSLLEKGTDFSALPETFVIFITERDYMGEGLPVYPVERCVLNTKKLFHDGAHILYVNGAYRDDSPIGWLMHDFSCTDPADMHYDILAYRVKFFKKEKEGIAVMCKAMEEMRNESLQEGIAQGKKLGLQEGLTQGKSLGKLEGIQESALRMLKAGKYTLEEIVSISGLSLEEVQKLKAENSL